jgi:uncharacterized protein
MKLLRIIALALCVLPLSAYSFSVPAKPTGYVLDHAHILSSEEVGMLEANITAFEKETGNEIAVVILQNLEGDTIENVAQEIFTAWGIGKKDINNGVLFLASIEDRRLRIHVGYGLEPTLTDIVAHNIEQDTIVPRFKQNDYAGGILEGVQAIESIIKDPAQAKYYEEVKDDSSFGFFAFMFFTIIIWLTSILGRSKSWWAGGVIGFVIGIINMIVMFVSASFIINILIIVATSLIGLFLDYTVSKNYKKNMVQGLRNPWWIGGGGGGSSGGGFGGFGGGSSGGGGASSSW